MTTTAVKGCLLLFCGWLGVAVAAELPAEFVRARAATGLGETVVKPLPSRPPDNREPRRVRAHFSWVANLVAPNGGEIKIYAQDDITPAQRRRAQNLVAHYLTNLPNSRHGADKTAVANRLASSGCELNLLNGAHDEDNEPGDYAQGQWLFHDEMQTEGGRWFQEQDFFHRDASFEEILHFVHDCGIGVPGGYIRGAAPAYSAAIRRARQASGPQGSGAWAGDFYFDEWIEELAAENSLDQEYLAAVLDVFYGLTAADDSDERLHRARTREALAAIDAAGLRLMRDFFPPVFAFPARVSPEFNGVFSIAFNPRLSYTQVSRYFLDVELAGANPSGIRGNDGANYLAGNAGDNRIWGGGGVDVAAFRGSRAEYRIRREGSLLSVADRVPNRDGRDLLHEDVEWLLFADGAVRAGEVGGESES